MKAICAADIAGLHEVLKLGQLELNACVEVEPASHVKRKCTFLTALVEECKADGKTKLKIAQLLIDAGARPDAASLCLAPPELMSLFLSALLRAPPVEVQPIHSYTATPLHAHAKLGRAEQCKQLLEAKASVDAKDESGSTPLLLAVESCHSEVMRLLLSANADPTIANKAGQTALSIKIARSTAPTDASTSAATESDDLQLLLSQSPTSKAKASSESDRLVN